MICTNQFLHAQIIIITNPQFLNFLILRNQVTTETEPGDTVAFTAAKRSPPLTGTVFDVHKIPVSEWIEYMIHLFDFHFLSSSAIKEDMDFLNDIDKESLTDALDTRISTSMSFKVKNKEVKIETTQKYNRFDTCYQTFLFVSFDILFVFLL